MADARHGKIAIQIINVILGIASVALSWYAYYWSLFNQFIRYDKLWYIENLVEENAFMYVTLILVLFSIVSVIITCASVAKSGEVGYNRAYGVVDSICHFVAGLSLLVVGGLLIHSTLEIDWYKCIQLEQYLHQEGLVHLFLGAPCQYYGEKLGAGAIAIVNGLFYGIAGIMALSYKPQY